jgi:hypothetical protein
MKKYLFLLLLFAQQTIACDFCNCYLGLNPHYKKNTFGIRYHHMYYNGTHMSNDELQEMDLSKTDFLEARTQVELHGQYYPVQKLQVAWSLPYLISNEYMRSMPEDGERIQGIGDALIMANYQLFNHTETDSSHFSHRLLAGGGVKVPLGNWKLEDDTEPNERVHMPGTGSWDYLLSAIYLAKYNRTGFNLNVSYLATTTNSQEFRFANRFNTNATCYYQVRIKETMLYPNAGAYLEQAGKDINGNSLLENSGGTILFAHTGFDIYFQKISINTAFQLPFYQQLNENQPELKNRWIVGLSYAFN